MFLVYPDWLLWTISGLGFVLCVYTLVRWRRSWEACRPMPFKSMRVRYIKGLVFALALMTGPYLLSATSSCNPQPDGSCSGQVA